MLPSRVGFVLRQATSSVSSADGDASPPRTTNIESIAPTSMIEASGTQYFRQVVITWSMRSRGSVQRSQIMKITPRKPLVTRLQAAQAVAEETQHRRSGSDRRPSPSIVAIGIGPFQPPQEQQRAEHSQQEHRRSIRP